MLVIHRLSSTTALMVIPFRTSSHVPVSPGYPHPHEEKSSIAIKPEAGDRTNLLSILS